MYTLYTAVYPQFELCSHCVYVYMCLCCLGQGDTSSGSDVSQIGVSSGASGSGVDISLYHVGNKYCSELHNDHSFSYNIIYFSNS